MVNKDLGHLVIVINNQGYRHSTILKLYRKLILTTINDGTDIIIV